MKKFIPLALCLALSLVSKPALAVYNPLPHNLVANTSAKASDVQGNFTTAYNMLNANLGSSNMSLTEGIGANYIVASGGTATGNYQAGGYKYGPAIISQVPLTVQGLSGQTANLFNVVNSSATILFGVDANGSVAATNYHAGTNGTATTGGAIGYGVNAGGYTSATLGSSNTATADTITAEIFGIFAQSGNVDLFSLDHSGNTGQVGDANIGGKILVVGAGVIGGNLGVNGTANLNGTNVTGTLAVTGNSTATGTMSNSGMTSTGTVSTSGAIVGGTIQSNGTLNAGGLVSETLGGVTYPVPFDQSGAGAAAHFEHNTISTGSPSVGAFACLGPYNITFSRTFGAVPYVGLTMVDSGAAIPQVTVALSSRTGSGAVAKLCNSTASPLTGPANIDWYALGD